MSKVGLVMEGGAMRGMFTAGVIDVLMENGIELDGAIGVSAGATFGCNYKSRQPGRVIRYNKRFAGNWRYCSVRSLLFTGDLYGADFCYNLLPNKLDIWDVNTFRSNPMPFYVVASDCETGLPVYHQLETGDEHDLVWMRASASMPLASKIVQVDGYKLLDGGMTSSIPLKYFESIGYEKNLVILTQSREFEKRPAEFMGLMRFFLKKYPRLLEAMARRHEVYNQEKEYALSQDEKHLAMVICPSSPVDIHRTEKDPEKLQALYDEGRRIAMEKLPEIIEFIKR